VLRILEVFDPGTPALTVSTLSRRSGLPLPTVSRLVQEMVEQGLLQRTDDRRVRTGITLWEIASRAAPTLRLRELAMPFMEDLHAVVGHHVQLAVLQECEALIVERLSSPGAVQNFSPIAGRLPLHISSSGLVLLAHSPSDFQDKVLTEQHGRLRRYTAQSVTDERKLRALLSNVRHTGLAFCPGFVDVRATGIAVPLRDDTGTVMAALSTIVPNDDGARAVVPALMATGNAISRFLASPNNALAATQQRPLPR
jgi:DNA-binding IclR family transcriptional regulator